MNAGGLAASHRTPRFERSPPDSCISLDVGATAYRLASAFGRPEFMRREMASDGDEERHANRPSRQWSS